MCVHIRSGTLGSCCSVLCDRQRFANNSEGIFAACFSALRSLIAVDLMGLEKLTNAFGILMLFQGLAAVIGSPIAGECQTRPGSRP